MNIRKSRSNKDDIAKASWCAAIGWKGYKQMTRTWRELGRAAAQRREDMIYDVLMLGIPSDVMASGTNLNYTSARLSLAEFQLKHMAPPRPRNVQAPQVTSHR